MKPGCVVSESCLESDGEESLSIAAGTALAFAVLARCDRRVGKDLRYV